MNASVPQILAVLERGRFLWSTEDDLQRGLCELLGDYWDVHREVRLNARDRIDLLIGRVGIEVKVAGSWRDVGRQLERYLESDLLDELVLVTPVAMHSRVPPRPRLHIHRLKRSGL